LVGLGLLFNNELSSSHKSTRKEEIKQNSEKERYSGQGFWRRVATSLTSAEFGSSAILPVRWPK